MQLLIVLLAGNDENALYLWVGGPFCMRIITYVVDYTFSDLIKVLFYCVFFLATDTLHNKVFFTIYYD